MSGSMPDPDNPGEIQFIWTIDIPANGPLPTGMYSLPVESASVLFEGPYQITWEIER